jgi:prepilin-type N-terminal cleavage/methylation domain-containing protein
MRATSRHRPAFTLLELLVAMSLMAVVAGSLYSLLYTGFRARERAEAAVHPSATVSMVFEMLERDLAGAQPPGGVLAGEFLGTDGDPGDELAFYTANLIADDDEVTGGSAKVELLLIESEDAEGYRLVRRLTRNLLSPRSLEPEAETLCRDVATFDLRYHDGFGWQDSWDSTAMEDTLPMAVEVSIGLQTNASASTDESTYVCTRAFRIPCGVPQADIGTNAAGGLQ